MQEARLHRCCKEGYGNASLSEATLARSSEDVAALTHGLPFNIPTTFQFNACCVCFATSQKKGCEMPRN
eukprot:257109-Amphidinium_carterae.1